MVSNLGFLGFVSAFDGNIVEIALPSSFIDNWVVACPKLLVQNEVFHLLWRRKKRPNLYLFTSNFFFPISEKQKPYSNSNYTMQVVQYIWNIICSCTRFDKWDLWESCHKSVLTTSKYIYIFKGGVLYLLESHTCKKSAWLPLISGTPVLLQQLH